MQYSKILHVGFRCLTKQANSCPNLNQCGWRFFSQDASEKLYSALYVSNRYNMKVYPILRPNLDYEFVIKNWQSIKDSAAMRGMQCEEFNLTNEQMGEKVHQLIDLDVMMKQVAEELLIKDNENDRAAVAEITAKLKTLKNTYFDCENNIIPILLSRPNVLHPETGMVRKVVGKCGNGNEARFTGSHLDFGRKNKCLFFHDLSPGGFYLVDKIAQLELAIIDYFRNALRSVGFGSISTPSFVQTAIMEATGKFYTHQQSAIQLKGKKNDDLVQEYLVGSSALEAMVAYFTRIVIPKKALPLQLFTVGRHYSGKSNASLGLYDTVQSTRIECFMVCEAKDTETLFDNTINLLKNAYDSMKIPYQIVVVSAKELDLTETICVQIELWSPFLQRYLPCAKVSQHSDYLSKRLLIETREKNIGTEYVHSLSATATSVPVLIASLIENRPEENDLYIPDILQSFFE